MRKLVTGLAAALIVGAAAALLLGPLTRADAAEAEPGPPGHVKIVSGSGRLTG